MCWLVLFGNRLQTDLITKALNVVFTELLAFAEMRDPLILLRDLDHAGLVC